MLFDIINKFDKTSIKENKRIVIPVKKITDENSIFSVSPKKKKKKINIVFK
ncbi:hypothetical protein [Spiroplasma sp. ChiS]|uniref:hypothetical protein n=1 Tax=Spiroplasma sp. ChiS TaxID=2099885 RepID=UPI00139243A8|nr:hypothetical protein [Spiroplasma sp. ChiS]